MGIKGILNYLKYKNKQLHTFLCIAVVLCYTIICEGGALLPVLKGPFQNKSDESIYDIVFALVKIKRKIFSLNIILLFPVIYISFFIYTNANFFVYLLVGITNGLCIGFDAPTAASTN